LVLSERAPDLKPPYQRLLGGAMRDNGELFGRDDIADAHRRIVETVLGAATPVYPYESGSWGPDEAQALIDPDGPWHNPNPAAEAAA